MSISALRQSDFSADGKMAGAPWLGMNIAEVPQLDRVLVVGTTLAQGSSADRASAAAGCEESVEN